MTQYQAPPSTFPPAPPPLLPAYVPPPRKPIWHKVIGIISICLGGLGLLCGLINMIVGTAVQSMMSAFSKIKISRVPPTTGPDSRPAPGPDVPMEDFNPFEMFNIPDWIHYTQMAFQILTLVAAALLLWAGVSLLQQRRRGLGLHVGYVVLQTIAVVGTAAVTVAFMHSIRVPGAPPFFRWIMTMQSVFGVIMQLLFGLAYPVFLVIWFARKNVRAQVRGWGVPGRDDQLPPMPA